MSKNIVKRNGVLPAQPFPPRQAIFMPGGKSIYPFILLSIITSITSPMTDHISFFVTTGCRRM